MIRRTIVKPYFAMQKPYASLTWQKAKGEVPNKCLPRLSLAELAPDLIEVFLLDRWRLYSICNQLLFFSELQLVILIRQA